MAFVYRVIEIDEEDEGALDVFLSGLSPAGLNLGTGIAAGDGYHSVGILDWDTLWYGYGIYDSDTYHPYGILWDDSGTPTYEETGIYTGTTWYVDGIWTSTDYHESGIYSTNGSAWWSAGIWTDDHYYEWGILDSEGSYCEDGILDNAGTHYDAGILDDSDNYHSEGIFAGVDYYETGIYDGSQWSAAGTLDDASHYEQYGVLYDDAGVVTYATEASRNTDPGEANVKDGTGYTILNVAKEGTLAAQGGMLVV